MNWFLLALACAYLTSTGEVFSKFLMRDNDEWTTGTAIVTVSFPFMALLLLGRDTFPVSGNLLLLMAVQIPFEVLAYYLYLKAIRMSPLSLSIPYLSFTPVFTILTAAILLGESVSSQGAVGILVVTVGAYVLNIEQSIHHPLAPLKAIFKTPGSRYMLLVALIWSLTATLGKKGVQLSDPVFFGVLYILALSISMGAVQAWRMKRRVATVDLRRRNVLLFTLAGLCIALAMIAHYHAIALVQVPYMISVKRTSLVFSVLYGGLVFKEGNIRLRLLGTSIMLSGAVILYVAS